MIQPFLHWCSPVTRRLARNYVGYFDRYRTLILAACLAALADLFSTLHFMHHDGIHHELHPGIRIAAEQLGPELGVTLGKLAQLAALFLVTLYLRHIARLIFIAAAVMYTWAAWYNVWGRDIYTPLLIEMLPL